MTDSAMPPKRVEISDETVAEAMRLTMERLGRGGEAPGLRAARSVLRYLNLSPVR